MFKKILNISVKKKGTPKKKANQADIQAKRDKIAKAACDRQNNWRQKTSVVDSKDKIIASIRANYKSRNKDEPIGLYSSSVVVLRNHLDYIRSLT